MRQYAGGKVFSGEQDWADCPTCTTTVPYRRSPYAKWYCHQTVLHRRRNELFEWLQVASSHEDSQLWSEITWPQCVINSDKKCFSHNFSCTLLSKNSVSSSNSTFSIPSFFFLQKFSFIFQLYLHCYIVSVWNAHQVAFKPETCLFMDCDKLADRVSNYMWFLLLIIHLLSKQSGKIIANGKTPWLYLNT